MCESCSSSCIASVETGNTVLVIEHNLDVIKTADYLIDMGPEGGHKGGTIIASGTPEEVAASAESHTGAYLAAIFEKAAKKRLPIAAETRKAYAKTAV